tara:strand:+ start:17850 stop:18452 length:603 start_codon:yes stop_codon:yes gene_type:complete
MDELPNLFWHRYKVKKSDRELNNGHRSSVVWFTGLSASGKSSLALAVEEKLHKLGCQAYVLDGDNVRHGLCSDLGFSKEDRSENLRRIGETAKLMSEAGIIVLTAFISPFQKDREYVRNLFPQGDFLEIYCDASLDVCEKRDPKGLYKKARIGEIADFTGISSPYEIPTNPQLICNTGEDSVDLNSDKVLEILREKKVIN